MADARGPATASRAWGHFVVSSWIKATEVAALQRTKRLQVTLENVDLALFYVDGSVYALRDVCIHKGSRLSKGRVFQGKVVCPGHQWAFDLRTGWVDQWARCQPVFPVMVENGVVYVKLEPQVLQAPPDVAPCQRQSE